MTPRQLRNHWHRLRSKAHQVVTSLELSRSRDGAHRLILERVLTAFFLRRHRMHVPCEQLSAWMLEQGGCVRGTSTRTVNRALVDDLEGAGLLVVERDGYARQRRGRRAWWRSCLVVAPSPELIAELGDAARILMRASQGAISQCLGASFEVVRQRWPMQYSGPLRVLPGGLRRTVQAGDSSPPDRGELWKQWLPGIAAKVAALG